MAIILVSLLLLLSTPFTHIYFSQFTLLPGKALFVIVGATCFIITPEEKQRKHGLLSQQPTQNTQQCPSSCFIKRTNWDQCTWTTCFLHHHHHHQSLACSMEKRDTWEALHKYSQEFRPQMSKAKVHQSADMHNTMLTYYHKTYRYHTHTLTQLVSCWSLLAPQPRHLLGSHLPPYPDLGLAILLITQRHTEAGDFLLCFEHWKGN